MQCLADNNEVGLLFFEKNLKLVEAIDGTKIYNLQKEVGEINTITAICYLINRFNSNFNFGKSLTSQQSAILASDIVEKYPYETIEDIVLMFKQVRQGIIGDGKDFKLDGQNVLTKWMPEYLDKKYQELERINKKVSSELNSQESLSSNAVAQFYAKRKAEKEKQENLKNAYQKIDEMCKEMDRQTLEDTISDWSKKDEMKPYLDYLKRKRLIIK